MLHTSFPLEKRGFAVQQPEARSGALKAYAGSKRQRTEG